MKRMDIPLVSVVVPVYNVAAYLPQCIGSLTSQTLTQIEILCIDDGSSDDSVALIRSMQEQDPRVVLLQQVHRGVSAARNMGISSARGTYIAFVDSDDWTDPDMLRKMVDHAEEQTADVVVCSARVHFEEGCTDPARRRESLVRALTVPRDTVLENDRQTMAWEILDRPGAWPFIWNKLIRRDVLQENRICFPEGLALGEDGVFLQLLYQYAQRVAFLEDALYHYRYQRRDSATERLYQHGTTRFDQHVGVVDALAGSLRDGELLNENGEPLLQWLIRFLYADFVSLPAPLHRQKARKFRALYERYGLVRFAAGCTGTERRRLEQLLETTKECPEWKRAYEMIRMKVENRILRMLCRT